MQVEYDGAHSVLIGKLVDAASQYGVVHPVYDRSKFKDTWEDYHLIPQTRPVIAPPSVQENTVEVPGSNGIVDLSEVLLGHPLYYNRSGSLDFYVDHTYAWTWDEAYDTLLNDIHGFNKNLILKDAMGFYYEGRLSVNSWKSDKLCSSITLDYNFAPFKRLLFTSGDDWLWDPFDFVNGYILDREETYEKVIPASGSGFLTFDRISAGLMPVVPDIIIVPTANIDSDVANKNVYVQSFTSYTEPNGEPSGIDSTDKSYFTTSEKVTTTNNYRKHDPLIVLGAPIDQWTTIKLTNNSSQDIKMVIDFRQGRL